MLKFYSLTFFHKLHSIFGNEFSATLGLRVGNDSGTDKTRQGLWRPFDLCALCPSASDTEWLRPLVWTETLNPCKDGKDKDDKEPVWFPSFPSNSIPWFRILHIRQSPFRHISNRRWLVENTCILKIPASILKYDWLTRLKITYPFLRLSDWSDQKDMTNLDQSCQFRNAAICRRQTESVLPVFHSRVWW